MLAAPARASHRHLALWSTHSLARLEDRWQGAACTSTRPRARPSLRRRPRSASARAACSTCCRTPRTHAGEAHAGRLAARRRHARRGAGAPGAVRELAGRDAFRDDLAVLEPDLPRAPRPRPLSAWAARRTRAARPWAAGGAGAALGVDARGADRVGVRADLPPGWGWRARWPRRRSCGWGLRRRVLAAIREVEARARDLRARRGTHRAGRSTSRSSALALWRAAGAGCAASGAPAADEDPPPVAARRPARPRGRTRSSGRCRCCSSGPRIWSWAIDRWRARAGRHVAGWFAALGELEALAALGTSPPSVPSAST